MTFNIYFGSRAKSYSGFSLVELLVVMSVMFVLMGILLSGLSGSRRSARRILCASRMRQTGLAMELYAASNDGWIVSARELIYSHSAAEALQAWHTSLLPYIFKGVNRKEILENTAELWFCPEDKDPYPKGFKNCPHDGLATFALNGFFSDNEPFKPANKIQLGPGGGYKYLEILQSSECMLMGETSYAAQFYDGEHPSVMGQGIRMDGHYRVTSGFYHSGAMNVLYVDGHVTKVRGVQCEKQNSYTPANYAGGRYMHWPELRLRSASEAGEFWGPGYGEDF